MSNNKLTADEITDQSVPQQSGYYGYMPGFNMINNHLIKPLMFATEKVFEKYIAVPAEKPGHLQPAGDHEMLEDNPMSSEGKSESHSSAAGSSLFGSGGFDHC